MYRVSLVQPNFAQGADTYKSYWLPHSIACVYAYTAYDENFSDLFELNRIIFRRENIESASLSMLSDDIVLFSNYIWNWEYNKKLAKKIKTINPNCSIVFGGPQISEHRLNQQQRELWYVDSFIISEGELSFREFCNDYLNKSIKSVYSIKRLNDLDIPSPYLMGFFDKLIKDNPTVRWNTTLETNRGCPFKCTFCDWGSLTYAKIKRFPMPKVQQEIEWISKNKIDYVFIADANFGIFPERDMQIAKWMTKYQDKYGYPEVWNANWHKNSRQNVIPIVEHLTKGGKNRAMTISVQSMNENVQTAIERKNMDISHLEDMFEIINSKGLASYTELILPLPLETAESWREGLAEVLHIGQHNSIEIWFHQLLENAESTKNHIEKYAFKTRELSGYVSGDLAFDEDNTLEKSEIVVETSTMSLNEFLDCWMYASMIINFHCGGWTQLISRVQVTLNFTDYKTFYDKLFDKLWNDDTVIGIQWRKQKQELIWFLNDQAPNGFSAHTFLWKFNRVLHENFKYTWKFIFSAFDIESDLATAQREFIHNYNDIYPKQVELNSNYYDFIENNTSLLKSGSFKYTLDVNIQAENFKSHLDNLYFKRRMGYGRTAIR